nr:MAG TPA: hypothetical protein [Caudoviricetes sp.]
MWFSNSKLIEFDQFPKWKILNIATCSKIEQVQLFQK